MGIELLNKRTYNAKTFLNGDGTFTLKVHAGHIHYKDALGDFQDSVFDLEDMGTYWRMVRHNYRLYIAKDFGAADLIRFDNKWEGCNHSVYYEPHSLRWVNNPDLSDMSVFRTAQAVTGVMVASNKIRWTDAFGAGLHFEVVLQRSGFKKEIVIDTLSNLENPPTADHRLAVISRYRGDGLKVVAENSAIDWDEDGYYEGVDGFRIEESANRILKSLIRPAYIEQSDAFQTKKSLKLFWKKIGTSLFQAKILPNKSWFLNATFPVRADATTSYYAGAGDGRITSATRASWDLNHDATSGLGWDGTSGTAPSYTGGAEALRIGLDGSSLYFINRMFFPVDTSGLPSAAVISAATFYVTTDTNTILNDDNDGDDFLTIVQTSQASPTSLTADDFDQCGAIDNPTEGINSGARIDFSTLATATQYSFALNSTGIGWIDPDGYTYLGMREGHDVLDHPFSGSADSWNFANWRTSEYTGTSSDPYLEVTYTVPETIQIGAASLLFTGNAITVNAKTFRSIAAGAIAYTGQAFVSNAKSVIAMGLASMVYTGQSITTNAKALIDIAATALLYTGQVLTVSGTQIIQIANAAMQYTGQALKKTEILYITAASILYTGQSLVINLREYLSILSGALIYTGQALKKNEIYIMAAATMTYIGRSISVIAGGATSIVRRSKWLVSLVGSSRRKRP